MTLQVAIIVAWLDGEADGAGREKRRETFGGREGGRYRKTEGGRIRGMGVAAELTDAGWYVGRRVGGWAGRGVHSQPL